MRVMTINALSLFQAGMYHGFVQSDVFVVMALEANLITLPFQQKLWQDPMSQVAIFAFFFFNDCVYILHWQVFGCKLGVALQALFARKLTRFKRRPGGTGSNVNQTPDKKKHGHGAVFINCRKFVRVQAHYLRSVL